MDGREGELRLIGQGLDLLLGENASKRLLLPSTRLEPARAGLLGLARELVNLTNEMGRRDEVAAELEDKVEVGEERKVAGFDLAEELKMDEEEREGRGENAKEMRSNEDTCMPEVTKFSLAQERIRDE